MKRIYEKPVAIEEAFIANEYVAACYYLACDVGPAKSNGKPGRPGSGSNQTNYSNGPYWGANEFGGVSHSAANTPNTCADAKANRVITDQGGLLSGANVGEYNGEQGWITGGIDTWLDTNGNGIVDTNDVIYWHTFDKNQERRWNHRGVLTSGSNPNHS